MEMIVLGVTHPISLNSAACLLVNGRLIAFAEEERFLRYKQAPHVFPHEAVAFCLRKAGIRPADVDATAIGFEQPDRSHVRHARADDYIAGSVTDAHWFDFVTSLALIHCDTKVKHHGTKFYFDHHLCHAASAAVPSDFDCANVITLDAWGGKRSGLLGFFDRRQGIRPLREVDPLRSWGATYELITEYLGFRTHSGEGKTMGLAAYGSQDANLLPDYCDPRFGLPDVRRYEAYLAARFEVRSPTQPLEQWHRDLAATLQSYYERSLVKQARWLSSKTGCRNFVLAGGVALNCSGNGALAQHDFVDGIFVQPASHDAGTALGAAILAHERLAGSWPDTRFTHPYWGASYSDEDVRAALDFARVPFERCEPAAAAAEALARNEIVGWHQGAGEVGPRALGNRSMLAHPGFAENLRRVNEDVKRRETWRPLAPSVLAERFHEIFDARHASPYMLVASQVRPEWRARLPAIVHVDGSSRPQAVASDTNVLFHTLILRFEAATGLPVVLNTSFNHRDEPIVESPADAIGTFYRTGIDTLVVGDYVVKKK